MIQPGDLSIMLDDPRILWAGAGLGLMLILLVMAMLRAARAERMVRPLIDMLGRLDSQIGALNAAQERLAGGLTHVAEAQAAQQAQVLQLMETRLAEATRAMTDSLHGNAARTARSLGALQERLEVIDRAQSKLEKLSSEVLSLQDILSNKQTRGAFGEIQLHDIVHKALPPDSFTMQATLSNGRRADCLIHLPRPPGPIVVDAKFPLEAYEKLRRARNESERIEAQREMRISLRNHIRAISERYIIEGETADGAILFLPSEAVYAELHANFPELVREGFAARVWIVSPTTCMATLNTMRAVLKDARMREQAGAIRAALRQLHRDIELVVERAGKLSTHFDQARADLDGIATAAERAGRRAARLDAFDFEGEDAPDRQLQRAP